MIQSAKNPKWAGADHEMIKIEIKVDGFWINFMASPTDCTEHGPLLYNLSIEGLFGPVADSDEERIIAGEMPVPEGYIVQDGQLVNVAMYEREATEKLNRRLAILNSEESRARAEIDEEYAAERKAKLAALLAVKQQPGWPIEVEWPE